MILSRLLVTLKKGNVPSEKVLKKVESVLPRGIIERLTKYCSGDKRIRVEKLVMDISAVLKRVKTGGGWEFEADGNKYKINHGGVEYDVGEKTLSPTKQEIVEIDGQEYRVGSLINEGSFARVHSFTPPNGYAIKIYKDPSTSKVFLQNLGNIYSHLSKSVRDGRTTFAMEPTIGNNYYILKECSGALTDAFSYLEKAEDIISNITWLNLSVSKAITNVITINLTKASVIHGDMKLENVLYTEIDFIYLHDFDGSLLDVDGKRISSRDHNITVRYTHPLYFVFKEVYYPGQPSSTFMKNQPLSLIWNLYLSMETQTIDGDLRTALYQAHKALILYLHNDETEIQGHNIVDAFIAIAKKEGYVTFNKNADFDKTIDLVFPVEQHPGMIEEWRSKWDIFSLRCSVFIRACIWCAFYEKRTPPSENLIDVIRGFCHQALKDLKEIVSFKPTAGGKKGGRRMLKRGGGGPKVVKNVELEAFMNPERNNIMTKNIWLKLEEDNANASISGYTNGTSSRRSTLTGMMMPGEYVHEHNTENIKY